VVAKCEEIQGRNKTEKASLDSLLQQLSFTNGTFESTRESAVARRAKLEKSRREFEEKGLLPANPNGAFDANSFGEVVRAVEKRIQSAQEDATRRQAAQLLYARFVDQTRDTHACPLCEQGLSDEDAFVAHLHEKGEEESRLCRVAVDEEDDGKEQLMTPEKAREALEALERRRETLRAMQGDWEAMCLEAFEVPRLERQVAESRGRVESLQRAVERGEGEVAVLQARERSIKAALDVV
jgi:hypothetical protein